MAVENNRDREAKVLDDQQLENVSGGVLQILNGVHAENVRARRRNSLIENADEVSLIENADEVS